MKKRSSDGHVGATIYGTASPGKGAFLKARGLHQAIDYVNQDWTAELRRLTGGRGVELVLDPLGGSHWKQSFKALRHTGRLGMFGVSTATQSRLPGLLRLIPLGPGMPLFHPVFGVNWACGRTQPSATPCSSDCIHIGERFWFISDSM